MGGSSAFFGAAGVGHVLDAVATYLICNVVGGVVWVAGVSTFGYFAGTTLGASAMLTVSGGLLGAAAVYALGNWVLRVRRRAADFAKGVPS